MMEGAYFVGRVELLHWLNNFLSLNYKKVEEVCSASAYCQIMDAIYPGKVPLSKVKFDAKTEYDYINNFNVLQEVFGKVGIDKKIDVPKLVQGKFQDNLEFLQWMKRYFDLHYNSEENTYDAVGRRSQSKSKGATSSVKSPTSKTSTPPKKTTTQPKASPPLGAVKKTTPITKISAKGEDSEKILDLQRQLEELQASATAVQTDRDFYLGKLQKIEVICKEKEEEELSQEVLKVLYATAEDAQEGQEQPAEEEEVQEEVQEAEEESY